MDFPWTGCSALDVGAAELPDVLACLQEFSHLCAGQSVLPRPPGGGRGHHSPPAACSGWSRAVSLAEHEKEKAASITSGDILNLKGKIDPVLAWQCALGGPPSLARAPLQVLPGWATPPASLPSSQGPQAAPPPRGLLLALVASGRRTSLSVCFAPIKAAV